MSEFLLFVIATDESETIDGFSASKETLVPAGASGCPRYFSRYSLYVGTPYSASSVGTTSRSPMTTSSRIASSVMVCFPSVK